MPYRVDVGDPSENTFDLLVELGALDVEVVTSGGMAALMPDSVAWAEVSAVLSGHNLRTSAAVARDAASVWVLRQRPIQVGPLRIMPAETDAEPGALRLADGAAFGTGHHPTTALCLETMIEIVERTAPEAVLDVGTGSGILALAALMRGVPTALAIDTDQKALRVAVDNARLNALEGRLQVAQGGPELVSGRWPLVLANILAAPLIEMAPALARCVGHHGRLVLSGIPTSVAPDVGHAYRRLGMRALGSDSRDGWVVLVFQASW